MALGRCSLMRAKRRRDMYAQSSRKPGFLWVGDWGSLPAEEITMIKAQGSGRNSHWVGGKAKRLVWQEQGMKVGHRAWAQRGR